LPTLTWRASLLHSAPGWAPGLAAPVEAVVGLVLVIGVGR
jgi:hypothetical protein